MYKIPNKQFLESKEWLIDMYVIKLKSATEIGNIVGCTKHSVLRALKRFDITIRKHTNKNPLLNDKEFIKMKYVNEELSLTQIAQLTNGTVGNIWTILQSLGVESRSYKEGFRTRFPNKRLGKEAPAWIDGRTPENHKVRTSIEYRAWRKAVFERDNYTCQECGQKGGDLEADHIKQFAYHPELR